MLGPPTISCFANTQSGDQGFTRFQEGFGFPKPKNQNFIEIISKKVVFCCSELAQTAKLSDTIPLSIVNTHHVSWVHCCSGSSFANPKNRIFSNPETLSPAGFDFESPREPKNEADAKCLGPLQRHSGLAQALVRVPIRSDVGAPNYFVLREHSQW